MQIVTIAGNIGRDSELRRTQKGDEVAGFTVAVSKGKDQPTTWWDCSLWGARAEKLAPYIRKGGKVTVTGEFSTREHEGKTYLQIRVSDIALQSRAEDSGHRAEPPAQASPHELNDEIPFAPSWR
jgi:single-strand DNA-binding protein